MEKVKNKDLIIKYMEKYNIRDIFTENIEEDMELILFKRNEYICRDGEEIEYLLFFVEGRAKVYITLANGKSLLLCFYYPFMILGDIEFINPNTATTNTQVVEDTYCLALPIEKARNKLIHDWKFLNYISKSLAVKLERASKNGSINLLYPLENRLASYISATMESRENVFVFSENLTTLSELLGTSYRHLHRTLNTMVDKKILKRSQYGYTVTDKEKLLSLSEEIYK